MTRARPADEDDPLVVALGDELAARHGRVAPQAVLRFALGSVGLSRRALAEPEQAPLIARALARAVRRFAGAAVRDAGLEERLAAVLRGGAGGEASAPPEEVVVRIQGEGDILVAQTAARRIAAHLGFASSHQVRIATATSELARNICYYARIGTITIGPTRGARPGVRVEALDRGPGIADLASILAGTYESERGLGLGLRGCQRLMDELDIKTGPGVGTRVTAIKYV